MGSFDSILYQLPVLLLACATTILGSGLLVQPASASEPDVLLLSDAKRVLRSLKDGQIECGGKECGLSCLYVFLKLHGVGRATYASIKDSVPIGTHGASLHGLAAASRKFGLRASPVRCAPSDLSGMPLPAIAHLERYGEEIPYLHYVVITEVGKSEVTLFDPFDNKVHSINRRELSVLLSGHFLACTVPSAMTESTILAVLGLVLLAVGVRCGVDVRRRSHPPHAGEGLARIGPICFVAIVSACLPGCNHASSKQSLSRKEINEGAAGSARSLEADKTNIDLGQILEASEAKGEFRVHNIGPLPVRLRLGPATCTCLNVELRANELLSPGEAADLVLFVDTAHQLKAGKIEACVPLFAGTDKEPVVFCVKGFLDGIVFPRERYVIRPAHRRAQKIPPLRFDVVTHDRSEFTVTRITGATFAEIAEMFAADGALGSVDLTDARPPSAKLPSAGLRSHVIADLATLSVSAPVFEPRDTVYVRHVEVQMGIPKSTTEGRFAGKIIVDYVLSGKESQAATDLLVLGRERN